MINQLPDSVKQSATDALNSVLGDTASTDLASVGDAFVCACKSITLNGLAQLGSVIGACAHDAACQLSHNTLECCPQTPTPLTQISCALPPCNSPYVYFPQPDPSQPNQNCTNGPSLASAGQGEVDDACFNTYWLSPHCFGDTCYSADPNRPPDGNPTNVCTCPIAMQFTCTRPRTAATSRAAVRPARSQKGNQCVCPGGATVSWNGGNVAPNCPPPPPPAAGLRADLQPRPDASSTAIKRRASTLASAPTVRSPPTANASRPAPAARSCWAAAPAARRPRRRPAAFAVPTA